MTYWHQSAQAIKALAAAYALGTLAGPARRRFETLMKTQPAVAQAVDDWNQRFEPLAARLQPVQASESLWARIEVETRRVDLARAKAGAPAVRAAPLAAAAPGAPKPGIVSAPPSAPTSSATPAPSPRAQPAAVPAWRRWLADWFAPVPAGALAFGLALGVLLPILPQMMRPPVAQDTELPESYVGVLATQEGRTGLIVSSLRRGKVMDVKRVAAVPVPAGKTLYLWALDATGKASAIGPLPEGAFVRVPLAQEAEPLFNKAVELAVSLEPVGGTSATPSGAFVYRGLCGKLWRLPPPPAASAAKS
jgi:anti-sigma-K factor RskA